VAVAKADDRAMTVCSFDGHSLDRCCYRLRDEWLLLLFSRDGRLLLLLLLLLLR
jgi:hypothetical protein